MTITATDAAVHAGFMARYMGRPREVPPYWTDAAAKWLKGWDACTLALTERYQGTSPRPSCSGNISSV